MEEVAPPQGSTVAAGGGVTLEGFQKIRDQVLELRIQEETQQQSSANAQANASQSIEPLFTSSGQDIGSQMSAYFTSLSALSASPADNTLRQGVMTAGQNLANSFQTTASGLIQIQASMNQTVPQDVVQINQLTQQIANLNGEITQQGGGNDTGALQDQRNNAVLNLSGLMNVSVIQTNQGFTLDHFQRDGFGSRQSKLRAVNNYGQRRYATRDGRWAGHHLFHLRRLAGRVVASARPGDTRIAQPVGHAGQHSRHQRELWKHCRL